MSINSHQSVKMCPPHLFVSVCYGVLLVSLSQTFFLSAFACVTKTQQRLLMTDVNKQRNELLSWLWENHASCSWSWKLLNEMWEEQAGKHPPQFKAIRLKGLKSKYQSGLTMDFLMWVSLLLALLSANSRLLMSFRRALYLLICSLIISSTHLQRREGQRGLTKENFWLLITN